MKIAICVIEINNERFISPTLTEAHYYLVVDSEAESTQNKILNSHSMNNDGSGIFCSQLLISKGVNKVICGNCEDNAKKLFNEARIEVDNNFEPYLNILVSEITDEKNLIYKWAICFKPGNSLLFPVSK